MIDVEDLVVVCALNNFLYPWFITLFQSYAPELPPVLHGISFQLKARERVGLLGRTGELSRLLFVSVSGMTFINRQWKVDLSNELVALCKFIFCTILFNY